MLSPTYVLIYHDYYLFQTLFGIQIGEMTTNALRLLEWVLQPQTSRCLPALCTPSGAASMDEHSEWFYAITLSILFLIYSSSIPHLILKPLTIYSSSHLFIQGCSTWTSCLRFSPVFCWSSLAVLGTLRWVDAKTPPTESTKLRFKKIYEKDLYHTCYRMWGD